LTGGGVAIVLFVSTALGGPTGFYIGLALVILLAIFGTNPKAQEQRLKTWQSTFRCGRCGTVFAVIEHDENPGGPALADMTEAERQIRLEHSAAGRSPSAGPSLLLKFP
jgi:hypothetical protein